MAGPLTAALRGGNRRRTGGDGTGQLGGQHSWVGAYPRKKPSSTRTHVKGGKFLVVVLRCEPAVIAHIQSMLGEQSREHIDFYTLRCFHSSRHWQDNP